MRGLRKGKTICAFFYLELSRALDVAEMSRDNLPDDYAIQPIDKGRIKSYGT